MLGRSRGGLSSKVHLAADFRCRPLAQVTSAGQRGDSLGFTPVLARIRRHGRGRPRTRPGQVGRQGLLQPRQPRLYLRQPHIHVVIPERAGEIRNRKNRGSRGGRPPGFNPQVHKRRNTVERAITRLKQNHAMTTRYDKRDHLWRGTVNVAAIRTWPHNPTQ